MERCMSRARIGRPPGPRARWLFACSARGRRLMIDDVARRALLQGKKAIAPSESRTWRRVREGRCGRGVRRQGTALARVW
jgi:hypothetical protein